MDSGDKRETLRAMLFDADTRHLWPRLNSTTGK